MADLQKTPRPRLPQRLPSYHTKTPSSILRTLSRITPLPPDKENNRPAGDKLRPKVPSNEATHLPIQEEHQNSTVPLVTPHSELADSSDVKTLDIALVEGNKTTNNTPTENLKGGDVRQETTQDTSTVPGLVSDHEVGNEFTKTQPLESPLAKMTTAARIQPSPYVPITLNYSFSKFTLPSALGTPAVTPFVKGRTMGGNAGEITDRRRGHRPPKTPSRQVPKLTLTTPAPRTSDNHPDDSFMVPQSADMDLLQFSHDETSLMRCSTPRVPGTFDFSHILSPIKPVPQTPTPLAKSEAPSSPLQSPFTLRPTGRSTSLSSSSSLGSISESELELDDKTEYTDQLFTLFPTPCNSADPTQEPSTTTGANHHNTLYHGVGALLTLQSTAQQLTTLSEDINEQLSTRLRTQLHESLETSSNVMENTSVGTWKSQGSFVQPGGPDPTCRKVLDDIHHVQGYLASSRLELQRLRESIDQQAAVEAELDRKISEASETLATLQVQLQDKQLASVLHTDVVVHHVCSPLSLPPEITTDMSMGMSTADHGAINKRTSVTTSLDTFATPSLTQCPAKGLRSQQGLHYDREYTPPPVHQVFLSPIYQLYCHIWRVVYRHGYSMVGILVLVLALEIAALATFYHVFRPHLPGSTWFDIPQAKVGSDANMLDLTATTACVTLPQENTCGKHFSADEPFGIPKSREDVNDVDDDITLFPDEKEPSIKDNTPDIADKPKDTSSTDEAIRTTPPNHTPWLTYSLAFQLHRMWTAMSENWEWPLDLSEWYDQVLTYVSQYMWSLYG
ncbi:hypothetical protein IWQ62_002989 [Dispira parvispora]|uniref:Uncharacterized protein n=1 Tax=Dispira parvispora TaxID=1520584 RepID=A0A9W8E243_9FUNG|nr:hypothetical protein IWQ62_002989 [Dispira parvispora]